MRNLLIGFIIMMTHLSIEGYGCNTKLLDTEAEAWVSKTWTKVTFNEDDIKKSLIFLNQSKEPLNNYKIYLDEDNFQKLYTRIQDLRLSHFASLCKNIYEENDLTKKISVFMLLQTVENKYKSILKKAESLKPLENKKQNNNSAMSSEKLLSIFLNADKSIRGK